MLRLLHTNVSSPYTLKTQDRTVADSHTSYFTQISSLKTIVFYVILKILYDTVIIQMALERESVLQFAHARHVTYQHSLCFSFIRALKDSIISSRKMFRFGFEVGLPGLCHC